MTVQTISFPTNSAASGYAIEATGPASNGVVPTQWSAAQAPVTHYLLSTTPAYTVPNTGGVYESLTYGMGTNLQIAIRALTSGSVGYLSIGMPLSLTASSGATTMQLGISIYDATNGVTLPNFGGTEGQDFITLKSANSLQFTPSGYALQIPLGTLGAMTHIAAATSLAFVLNNTGAVAPLVDAYGYSFVANIVPTALGA